MTKHTTIARRIEEMLSLYEALNDEATRWLISTSKRSRLLGAQAFRKAQCACSRSTIVSPVR